MTPYEILALWREAGGDTHGPIVETACIPLEDLPRFVEAVRENRRTLTQPARVGSTIFRAGVSERTVVERAQREFVEYGYGSPHWPGARPELKKQLEDLRPGAWRDISTAPADRPVLLREADGALYKAHWDAGRDEWECLHGQPVPFTPEPVEWAEVPQ